MKNRGNEFHNRWLERIVSREFDIEEEYTTGVWTTFGAGNRCSPFCNIVVEWSSATVGGWITHKLSKFFLKTFVKTHYVVYVVYVALCYVDLLNKYALLFLYC